MVATFVSLPVSFAWLWRGGGGGWGEQDKSLDRTRITSVICVVSLADYVLNPPPPPPPPPPCRRCLFLSSSSRKKKRKKEKNVIKHMVYISKVVKTGTRVTNKLRIKNKFKRSSVSRWFWVRSVFTHRTLSFYCLVKMLLFSFSLLPTDLIFERLANQNAGKSVKKKEEKEKNVLFTVKSTLCWLTSKVTKTTNTWYPNEASNLISQSLWKEDRSVHWFVCHDESSIYSFLPPQWAVTICLLLV